MDRKERRENKSEEKREALFQARVEIDNNAGNMLQRAQSK